MSTLPNAGGNYEYLKCHYIASANTVKGPLYPDTLSFHGKATGIQKSPHMGTGFFSHQGRTCRIDRQHKITYNELQDTEKANKRDDRVASEKGDLINAAMVSDALYHL